MKKIIKHALVAAICSSLATSGFSQPAKADSQSIERGRWITQSGNLEVEITPCANALCGTVVRVIANNSMSKPGSAMAAADARSPLGMKILSDFKPSGDAEWKGRIYNREDGETYDCVMTLLAPDQLKIRAYKGLPLFGKTQLWSRVAERVAQ